MPDLFALSDDQARDAGTAAPIAAEGVAYVTPADTPSCSRCAHWWRSQSALGRCHAPDGPHRGSLSSYAGHCATFLTATQDL